jgi:hypothetical protein
MAQTITHNIDAVLKGLDLYTRTKVPKAARVAIGRLGHDVANKFVPDRMNMVFENPNLFTLKSLEYKVVSNYEVQLDFKKDAGKGNDPARYLYPSTVGASAYETKFSRYLHAAGIAPGNYYPIPVRSNLRLNSYGKPSQGEYTKTWNGLQSRYGSKSKGAYRYFSVPDMRAGGQSGGMRFRSVSARRNRLGNGIYRVKGSKDKGSLDLQLLFTYAKSKPRTPRIFDYQSFVARVVERRAEGTFRRAFKEALG